MAEVKRSKTQEYNNYKLSRNSPNTIETIDLSDPKITKEYFYENFIKIRKPALIKYTEVNELFKVDIGSFKTDNILETLSLNEDEEELLQVEEIKNGGFGSGQKRLKMNMKEFLDRIKNKETLYLTTQYTENDPELEDFANGVCGEKYDEDNNEEHDEDDDEDDEEEATGFGEFVGNDDSDNDSLIIDPSNMHDDFDDEFGAISDNDEDLDTDFEEIDPIYQPPLSNLLLNNNLGKLPPNPTALTEPLVPQQINLWMGRTPSETMELKVEKSQQGIVGINRGLPSSNSTSTGLHHDHADNLYVLVQGKKRFTLFSPDFAKDLYTTGDVRCIYDTGVIDYIKNENAPFWKGVKSDGGCINVGGEDEEENNSVEHNEDLDPPSFCKIPPVLLHLDEVESDELPLYHEFIKEKYPAFNGIKDQSIKVNLSDGDLLYLPAGWFHEVTSYGDAKNDNIHIALNYWFVPPDNSNFDDLYSDKLWKQNYELWKAKYLKNKDLNF